MISIVAALVVLAMDDYAAIPFHLPDKFWLTTFSYRSALARWAIAGHLSRAKGPCRDVLGAAARW
jgi:hypothetical protein